MTTEKNNHDDKPLVGEYIKTYQNTQARDKVGMAGELAGGMAGAMAGYGLATNVAGFFGANIVTTTIPLAARLSFVLPTSVKLLLSFLPTGILRAGGLVATTTVTTPVGWVIGTTVIFASTAWGIVRLVRSGGINDERRRALGQQILQKLETIFHAMRQKHPDSSLEKMINSPVSADVSLQIERLLRELAQENILQSERVDTYIQGYRDGTLSLSFILHLLQQHGKALINPTVQGDSDEEMRRATSARVFTVLHKSAVNQDEEPGSAYLDVMQQNFGVDRGHALELYREAPLDSDPRLTVEQLKSLFRDDVVTSAFFALQQTAHSMSRGQAAFQRFLEIQQVMQAQFDQQIADIDRAGDELQRAMERL